MTKGIVILIILAIVILVESGLSSIDPLKETKFGVIKGKWMIAQSRGINRPVAAYLGIPYAQPPIGNLRFKSPEPWKKHWRNTRLAINDASMCPQLNWENEVIGNEDCLFLNIFVPQEAEKNPDLRYPVLVFVHGGGYKGGSNNSTFYSPNYLLYDKIILVTVNYRLGALGFLSTGDDLAPGNWGLKDIKMALQWIQENINTFGGDAESVTLWGQDAGAVLVHILALSEKTEGLFHKYITSGGSSLAHFAVETADKARQLAMDAAYQAKCISDKDMGRIKKCFQPVEENSTLSSEDTFQVDCTGNQNIQRMLHCMRRIKADVITRLKPSMLRDNAFLSYEFTPTIENDSEDAILTTNPLTLIKNGHFRDIPWITGLTKDEGLVKSLGISLYDNRIEQLLEKWNYYLPFLLELKWSLKDDISMADAIENFYYEGNFTASFPSNLTEMIGDALFNWPVYQAVKLQSKFMNSSVYFYVLGYEGTFSETYGIDAAKRYGVSHGDDINYLYPYLNNVFSDLLLHNTADDYTMIHIMTEMWTSFVKTGVPRADLSSSWEQFQSNDRYMKLGWEESTDITMESNFLPERMAFWEELIGNLSLPIYREEEDEEEKEEEEEEQKDKEEAASIQKDDKDASGDAAVITKTPMICFLSFFTLRFAR